MSKRTECRNGQHRYLEQAGVGAGLRRTVCADCGAVTIDISQEMAVTSVSSRLRETRIEALGTAAPVNWTS